MKELKQLPGALMADIAYGLFAGFLGFGVGLSVGLGSSLTPTHEPPAQCPIVQVTLK